jgi:hypothetical protein
MCVYDVCKCALLCWNLYTFQFNYWLACILNVHNASVYYVTCVHARLLLLLLLLL